MYEPAPLAPLALTWLTVATPPQPSRSSGPLRPMSCHERKAPAPEALKSFLKEAFARVVEDLEAPEAICRTYFAPEFIFRTDEQTLDLARFIARLKAQQRDLKCLQVRFEQMVVEGDRIATVHVTRGVRQDGRPVETRVHAVFQVRGGRICRCDELTRPLRGGPGLSPGSAPAGAAPEPSSR